MAKKAFDYEMEEFFIKKAQEENPKPVQEIKVEKCIPAEPNIAENTSPLESDDKTEHVVYAPDAFKQSLANFSSANRPKRKSKRKRKVNTNSIVRAFALVLCFAILCYSLVNIVQMSADRDVVRKKQQEYSVEARKSVGDRSMKNTKRPSDTKDLLSFLGSTMGGLEMFESLDTDIQVFYETLRELVYDKKKINPDCWGYIIVSRAQNYDDPIIAEQPVMKGPDNYYYLYRLEDKVANRGGSIFADSILKDDYDKNRNVVLYGHCMTDGSKFRGIKLFFDNDNRYSIAQDLEITVVTADKVYVYEYFSGYRAEGDRFATCFSTNSSAASFYQFLMERRRLNTISKDVSYDENSKIITLITCTNLSSKPTERYVLHGILKNVYEF